MAGDELSLASLRSLPLKDQVVRALMDLIEAGELPVGARLPGERALSERLEVSRNTVREAVQFLQALGVLEIRHGSGTYVRRSTMRDAGLSDEWREWTLRHSSRVRDLLEVRRGLESLAGELAAERASAADRAELREAIEQMAAAVATGDVTSLVQADVGFHHALVKAAGNVALVELADALGAQLVQERAATWNSPGRPDRSLAEHRAIHDAIASRDADRVREAVLAHLASVEHDVEGLVSAPARSSTPTKRGVRHA